jgi:formylglycine-generating enzyme required for sulfatase activity
VITPLMRAQEKEKYRNFRNRLGGEMLLITSGNFLMGSNSSVALANEQPVTSVTISRFYMSRFPVTNVEYERFDPSHASKRAPWATEQHPVIYVSAKDAERFCEWLSQTERRRYRLPTEAEWEYAARGGLDRQRYSWGNELRTPWQMNVWQGLFPRRDLGEDGFQGLAPVGSYSPNSYGLFDMSGNVAEWCADWYLPDYYKETSKGKESRDNPQGPDRSYDPAEPGVWKRVTRGGSWLTAAAVSRADWVSNRGKLAPDVPLPSVGFRCVRDATR